MSRRVIRRMTPGGRTVRGGSPGGMTVIPVAPDDGQPFEIFLPPSTPTEPSATEPFVLFPGGFGERFRSLLLRLPEPQPVGSFPPVQPFPEPTLEEQLQAEIDAERAGEPSGVGGEGSPRIEGVGGFPLPRTPEGRRTSTFTFPELGMIETAAQREVDATLRRCETTLRQAGRLPPAGAQAPPAPVTACAPVFVNCGCNEPRCCYCEED